MSVGDGGEDSQIDLLADVSDLDSVRHLLADLHDDLPGKVGRFHHLADLGAELGSGGTMLFGGTATLGAWTEARSSFVHGNYVATVLLCQSLVENLLAAFLHGGLLIDDLPPRIGFKDTLKRCQTGGMITEEDFHDLDRLMALRNPLSHFRNVGDPQNIDRRAIDISVHPDDLLRQDAWFAMGLAVRILAKPQFRLG
jgi:hypothetical protein